MHQYVYRLFILKKNKLLHGKEVEVKQMYSQNFRLHAFFLYTLHLKDIFGKIKNSHLYHIRYFGLVEWNFILI